MGYEEVDKSGNVKRLAVKNGNGADVVDIETLPSAAFADLGAGSVHHVAFAVENRAKQLEVRKALMDTGYQVTPVIDRDYFWAIYFRTPGGVLFEVATNEPGFDRDEDTAHLGEALKLPTQHAASAPLSRTASAAAGSAEDGDIDVEETAYMHTSAARFAGRPAALRLPRHRRRREPACFARARSAARGDDHLAARRCVRTRRGALLPPHRRGRLRHGRSGAGDGARWPASSRRMSRRQSHRRCSASAIPMAPTSWPRWCSPSLICSTPRC